MYPNSYTRIQRKKRAADPILTLRKPCPLNIKPTKIPRFPETAANQQIDYNSKRGNNEITVAAMKKSRITCLLPVTHCTLQFLILR